MFPRDQKVYLGSSGEATGPLRGAGATMNMPIGPTSPSLSLSRERGAGFEPP